NLEASRCCGCWARAYEVAAVKQRMRLTPRRKLGHGNRGRQSRLYHRRSTGAAEEMTGGVEVAEKMKTLK
ncbi:unnamed protein product, partial [Brassica oleracea]